MHGHIVNGCLASFFSPRGSWENDGGSDKGVGVGGGGFSAPPSQATGGFPHEEHGKPADLDHTCNLVQCCPVGGGPVFDMPAALGRIMKYGNRGRFLVLVLQSWQLWLTTSLFKGQVYCICSSVYS